MPKILRKMALNSGVQTYQILTNDDEIWIPRHSSIFLAVHPPSAVKEFADLLSCLFVTFSNKYHVIFEFSKSW